MDRLWIDSGSTLHRPRNDPESTWNRPCINLRRPWIDLVPDPDRSRNDSELAFDRPRIDPTWTPASCPARAVAMGQQDSVLEGCVVASDPPVHKCGRRRGRKPLATRPPFPRQTPMGWGHTGSGRSGGRAHMAGGSARQNVWAALEIHFVSRVLEQARRDAANMPTHARRVDRFAPESPE